MRSRRRRRGFTLIELLVVISIIGILVGLLLPAINAAREAGRRTQCASNMRNIGLGILGYVNSKNAFPAAGTFGENPKSISLTNPMSSTIVGFLPKSSSAAAGIPMYSWVVPTLPYLDNQELFNQWTMFSTGVSNGVSGLPVSYADTTNYVNGQASNATIANTAIGILRCPDDNTTQPNQGNLSYAVNGGFALWHAIPISLLGTQTDGGQMPQPMTWTATASTSTVDPATIGVMQKLGVFFLQSVLPQGMGTNVNIPWNIRSTLTGIADGASSTLMLSENTLTGFASSNPFFSGGGTYEGNWAAPQPALSMFIGSSAICSANKYMCYSNPPSPALLAPTSSMGAGGSSGDQDGAGWQGANHVGTFQNINFAQTAGLSVEGSFPFSNSGHPGGCNMMFCDGAVRFITNTIDGTVYSKLLTPAGSRLPLYCKQMPLSQDAFVSQ